MAVKSMARSSLRNNVFYRSLLAGNPAFDPASDFLLEEVVLSGDQASVEFTNLVSKYGAEYKHLQIRTLARCTNNSSLAGFQIRFNGDAGTNYSNHALENINNVMYSGNGVSHTQIAYYIPGNTATGGSFAPSMIDILDPFSTSKNTTTRTLSGFAAPGSWMMVQLTSGGWYNTAAVNSITLTPNQNSLLAGSRFSLYGSK